MPYKNINNIDAINATFPQICFLAHCTLQNPNVEKDILEQIYRKYSKKLVSSENNYAKQDILNQLVIILNKELTNHIKSPPCANEISPSSALETLPRARDYEYILPAKETSIPDAKIDLIYKLYFAQKYRDYIPPYFSLSDLN